MPNSLCLTYIYFPDFHISSLGYLYLLFVLHLIELHFMLLFFGKSENLIVSS